MKLPGSSNLRTAFLLALVLHLLLLLVPGMLRAEQKQLYRIGVLASRSNKDQCLRQWQNTAMDLTDKITGVVFSLVPLTYDELVPAVKARQVDFIIADSSLYVECEIFYGAQRIATLKHLSNGQSFTVYGGVIFTKADRKDLERLEDLKHKRFMATDKASFGGWLAARRELQEHGINPYRDFKELTFGGTQDAVVYAVQKGLVDAGTVRTDTLEHMASEGKIDLKDFQILHKRDSEVQNSKLPFRCSTRLYPEWPFAKLQHTPADLAEKVCIALLSIQPDDLAAVTGMYAGWTVPLNYQPVHECLKELRYGPYENFGKITIKDIWKLYWHTIIIIAVLLVIMALIINYVLHLNRELSRSKLVIQKEEEALHKSEQKFRSIIEESAEGIMLADEQGTIFEWNRSIEQITGLQRSEVLGRHICDVRFRLALKEQQTPAAYEQLKAMSIGFLKNGQGPGVGQTEYVEIEHSNGSRRVIQSLRFPIRTGSGYMFAGFVLDVTERKQAEAKLLETKDYLDNIINSSLDAILVSDMAACITQCNQAFLDLTGYTEVEVLGLPALEFTPVTGETYESTTGEIIQINEDFYTESVALISRLLETGKVANWEAFYLRKDKKVVPVEQSIFFLNDKEGTRIGSASIIRDSTKRKRAEEERERLIVELQEALAKVKTLSGFIPICASCKKIRDDQGYWQQVESYIRDRSEAEFSHSICPDCARRLYPEIYKNKSEAPRP